METGRVAEQTTSQSSAQKNQEDEKSKKNGTRQNSNQPQYREKGGFSRGGKGNYRGWQGRRRPQVYHDQRSKPPKAMFGDQTQEGQERRLGRDREVVDFLNRKLKKDSTQAAADTVGRSDADGKRQSETAALTDKKTQETAFVIEDGVATKISGAKEDKETSGKPNTKNYQAERPREKKRFDRKPHRERQNFPAKFVGYGHRTDPSAQMQWGQVYPSNEEWASFKQPNNYYRGNRRRDTQYKRKNRYMYNTSEGLQGDATSSRNTTINETTSHEMEGRDISYRTETQHEFTGSLEYGLEILNVGTADVGFGESADDSTSIHKQTETSNSNMQLQALTSNTQSLNSENAVTRRTSDQRPGSTRGQGFPHNRNNNDNLFGGPFGSRRGYMHSRSYRGKMKGWREDGSSDSFQSVQAGVLIEQLRSETYECMVCCDTIRCSAPVWNCTNCYHVFHLRCIRKWANSPSAVLEGEGGGWRCPACQNVEQQVPNVYWCYCGKVIEPRWNIREGITPHSCGELCQKKREVNDCPHNCNQLCHPGPCPSCPVVVAKTCACGKAKMQVRCGQPYSVLCKQECEKPLNCKVHKCSKSCHTGSCGICEIEVKQECYCGKDTRDVLCGEGERDSIDGREGYFSCQNVCERFLDCGQHKCERNCHQGQCTPCTLKPSLVTHCPCGKTPLDALLGEGNLRVSCTDIIPTCSYICGRPLPCTPQGQGASNVRQHLCKKPCHHGECGPCGGVSTVTCRCGAKTKEIPCADRKGGEQYLCERRCNKKKQCGRHRCNQKCCVDAEHACDLICGKKLRCGLHKCDEPCHAGHCHQCWNVSFDELTCYCGAAILYPPVPCGAASPECGKPCSRQHACLHPVNHTCHNDESCPPCTTLTKKMCLGQHEMRYNIPCHVTDVTCGKSCGKQLSCGHTCPKSCHKGQCSNYTCNQPCKEKRKECGHPCGAPCHSGSPCPPISCKVKVTVSCQCGRKTEKVPCLQGGDRAALTQAYQRLATETLASKMRDLQAGISVDVSTIMHLDEKKPRQIECDDECGLVERNRRLAEALQLDNANVSPHVGPVYSPFLLDEAKRNLGFIKSVEDALETLVTVVGKSQSPQRTHSFTPMNANQRRVVHEMAALYNCSSRSYDQEPLRNTVVTATKESYLPTTKLSLQIERELNPAPPPPVPFLPSRAPHTSRLKDTKADSVKKEQAWAQLPAPDYFADDFQD